ncbi:hypothetical protein [Streptomyces sp. TR06-5]|uniref:hypothetical protein n=1 Tax=Streptomyces sp. TR06-5 TaxID=3385976 RepID=UPI0039A0D6E7
MSARTARRWAPLAAKWLETGLSKLRIRQALTEGLDSARKPLGALHWRLQHALPEATPPSAQATAAEAPTPEPRVARMRECTTRHGQPRLFTPPPGADETLCPDCRTHRAPSPPLTASSGFAAYAAARQAHSATPAPAPAQHPPTSPDHLSLSSFVGATARDDERLEHCVLHRG